MRKETSNERRPPRKKGARVLTPEVHTALLSRFTVEHLLTLVSVEAKRFHDGHYAILAFREYYKAAFGTPSLYPDRSNGSSHAQVNAMPHFPTLKEALIAALVSGKEFTDYFSGDARTWFASWPPETEHV